MKILNVYSASRRCPRNTGLLIILSASRNIHSDQLYVKYFKIAVIDSYCAYNPVNFKADPGQILDLHWKKNGSRSRSFLQDLLIFFNKWRILKLLFFFIFFYANFLDFGFNSKIFFFVVFGWYFAPWIRIRIPSPGFPTVPKYCYLYRFHTNFWKRQNLHYGKIMVLSWIIYGTFSKVQWSLIILIQKPAFYLSFNC